MYRYNTLKGARRNAEANGYKGAQFPWESSDEGIEVTPKWGMDYNGNPVRIWTGDEEYHINSDITFGIWEYFRTTGDKDFLINCGLEIFFDTAKFWQSKVEYNKQEDRYEISKVIGPDEFHDHVNNNVYTNYLAKWSTKKSLELVDWIKEEDKVIFNRLCTNLGLSEEDFKVWQEIQQKIFIPMSKDGKIIEQFPGKKVIFLMILAMMMVPGQVVMVPTYMLLSKFGWVDSFKGMAIPFLYSLFNIFLMRQFF